MLRVELGLINLFMGIEVHYSSEAGLPQALSTNLSVIIDGVSDKTYFFDEKRVINLT